MHPIIITKEDIPKFIGKKIKSGSVLNLGYGDDGPLLEYATLREYLPLTNTKKAIWVYYEGNDLDNLDTEDFQIIELSRDNYYRLTIPPMVWTGFQGLGREPSLLLNIANIPHNPNEVDHLECDYVNYSWS